MLRKTILITFPKYPPPTKTTETENAPFPDTPPPHTFFRAERPIFIFFFLGK